MKELMMRIMNIDTHEEECIELQKKCDVLMRSYEETKDANNILARDVIALEDQLASLREDPERYIEEEIEKRLLIQERDMEERLRHRWKSEGRQEAFFDLGIRSIEAHERGNILVRLPDGEIVEMVLGLEDVNVEEERAEFYADSTHYYTEENSGELDSIQIDDLLHDVTIDDLEDVV